MKNISRFLLACMVILTARNSSFAAIPFSVPASQSNVVAMAMGYSCVADGTLYYSADCNPALYRVAPSRFEFGIAAGISPELIKALLYLKKHGKDLGAIYKNLNDGLANNDAAKIMAAQSDIRKAMETVGDKNFGAYLQPSTSYRISDKLGLGVYNNTNVFFRISKGQLADGIINLPYPINLSDPYTTQQIQNAIDTIKNTLEQALNAALTLPGAQDYIDGVIDLETFINGLTPADAKYIKQNVAYALADYLPSVQAIAYSDSVLAATYATEPFDSLPRLTAGTNLRLVNRRITIQYLSPLDFIGEKDTVKNILKEVKKSSTRLGADVGFTYSWPRPLNLRAGLMLQEILHGQGTVKGEGETSIINAFTTDPAPFIVNSGVSWDPSARWHVNLDLYDIFNKTILYGSENYFAHVNTGAQYKLLPWLGIRGGFNYRLPTGGFGLMFRNFNLDYAIAPNIFGVYSHFIQFRLLFGTQDKVDRDRDEDWPSKHWGSDIPTRESRPSISESQQSIEAGATESTEQPTESVEPPVESVPTAKKTYQDYLESADTYQSRNDYRNALREYGKAQKLLPPNDKRKVFTYEQQAQMALKLKNIPKAKEFYLAAIQTAKKLKASDSTVVNSYLGIAYCFERSGKKSLAIKNYEKAVTLTRNEATKERIRKNIQKLRGQR